MDKRIKKKWVKALRSGEYDQTAGNLCTEGLDGSCSFCCLGVLGNIFSEETGLLWSEDGSAMLNIGGQAELLDGPILQWAGIHIATQGWLSDMNDIEGATFEKIADHIENEL